jgi:GT2 family glycosyltransferase
LEPERDVELVDGRMVARSTEPWLRLVPVAALTRHRWVRIRYRTSFFDEPTRPLIRFRGKDGSFTQQPMNGPVLGAAEWVGHVPVGTVSVSITPTNRAGPFEFQVEWIRGASRLGLLARGARLYPLWTLLSIGARLIDSREEARRILKFAGSWTPLNEYDEWHARLARPVDLSGIDAGHVDWADAPRIRLFMRLQGESAEPVERTLASLRAQVFPNWTLMVVTDRPGAAREAVRRHRSADARIGEVAEDDAIEPSADGRPSWVGVIEPGDLLPELALAQLAHALARSSAAIIYGDEDSLAPDGRLHSPRFKPDWSPERFARSPYLGRLTLIGAGDLDAVGCKTVGNLIYDEGQFLGAVAATAAPRHLPRLVYRRVRSDGDEPPPLRAVSRSSTERRATPSAAVIVPTRDRSRLLSACLRGLRETTDHPNFEVVIVDNGSTEPDAVALLREAVRDSRFRVLSQPGPFIYSSLCNEGARATRADVLVFLNNDISMRERSWLTPLVSWAMRDDIGAVGAKLLYPDGSIQHAGVVLGMGGLAGHPYRTSAADNPGYLGCLRAPHEAAAVTGACLAVARSKFEAVGGYDVANLPIELNDIDLCLRLAERGWRTMWTPECVLLHHESASRGRQIYPHDVYRKERRYFAERWAHVIRDDPYFHPALSLYAYQPSLA